MTEFLKKWLHLKTDRRGVTAVEYAILAGVVITVLAGVGASFGTQLGAAFTNLGTSLTTHVQGN